MKHPPPGHYSLGHLLTISCWRTLLKDKEYVYEVYQKSYGSGVRKAVVQIQTTSFIFSQPSLSYQDFSGILNSAVVLAIHFLKTPLAHPLNITRGGKKSILFRNLPLSHRVLQSKQCRLNALELLATFWGLMITKKNVQYWQVCLKQDL